MGIPAGCAQRLAEPWDLLCERTATGKDWLNMLLPALNRLFFFLSRVKRDKSLKNRLDPLVTNC
jgi:hypothetical protein